ncbi:hypothetical protein GA0061073_0231 [Lactobacillus apis]|uniref:hypothetical protein n=1 Tax=Lactobacillus apis TaxID=303541 RepID=UPI0008158164|nr:hypothetical protein [Lactobacillus apis]GGG31805.1 hypothetical protein GCM10007323_02240 [Lactobacillus apis]SCB75498.1 hypothetical protein GA0061073_0231 [Lactobacillus apis]
MNNEISKANEARAFQTYIAWCEREEKIFSCISIIITLAIYFKRDLICQYLGTAYFWPILIILATVFLESTFLFSSQIYYTKRLLYSNRTKEDEEFHESFYKKMVPTFTLIVLILEWVIIPSFLIILSCFWLHFNLSNTIWLFLLVLIITALVLSYWTSKKKFEIYNNERSLFNIIADKIKRHDS